MAQVTVDFAQMMLRHADAGRHSPLTVWEEKQLALAWLDREYVRREAEGLMRIYGVETVTELIIAQARHVESLQENKEPNAMLSGAEAAETTERGSLSGVR